MNDPLDLLSRSEATHFWFQGYRDFLTPVLSQCARGRRDLRLVDCGCGTGANLALLEPYGAAFGFDVTAWRPARSAGGDVSTVRADITRIPFPAETFDLAAAFEVLACVEDDRSAVSEMHRVLRPGGSIVITLAALEVLRGDHSEVWNEYRRYTPTSARDLVEEVGFRVERVTFLFASLFPLMLAVRLGQRLTRPYRTPSGDSDLVVPPAAVNATLAWLVRKEAALTRRIPMPIGSSLLVVAAKPERS